MSLNLLRERPSYRYGFLERLEDGSYYSCPDGEISITIPPEGNKVKIVDLRNEVAFWEDLTPEQFFSFAMVDQVDGTFYTDADGIHQVCEENLPELEDPLVDYRKYLQTQDFKHWIREDPNNVAVYIVDDVWNGRNLYLCNPHWTGIWFCPIDTRGNDDHCVPCYPEWIPRRSLLNILMGEHWEEWTAENWNSKR